MRRFVAPFASGLLLIFFAMSASPAFAAQPPAAGNPAAVRAYSRVLQKINPQMPAWQSQSLAKHLLINADRWKIDANMLVALVTVESAWHTHARSWAGAIGLGQLMPGTADNLHVNPRDPYENLQGAARYLYGLLTRFRNKPNRYQLAFAAYNAGPKAVEEFGGIPPFAETQHYVVKVTSTWHAIRAMIRIPRMRVPAVIAAQSPDLSYWVGSAAQR
ncbi:MAG TPA: lytic transglycosylase domain-containing protein [Candidatus Baltobacteraceae bacterium]|nr:lytic transglycosylase domain-containing protein [Candidatus Baltobacteraceae bacterium]